MNIEGQIWLHMAFARLLEINVIGVIKTGALSDDNHCNADPNQGPDGIPDDYDSSALTPEDTARFQENVAKLGGDFENAGFSSDAEIIQSVERIEDDLATFASVEDYLDNQFGAGAPCPP